ncbi:argininosuccinate lyase [Desulfonatronospira thiodismutans ASO3-1]|uniref:Argininosuccinate lyase n=1 Tax=Desulfonatronospira thiodismutans ASO3-1 TaxID=555779 RepID=D6SL32_9BACT|nr:MULTISPECIES: argininosuccinate lyase [Desulfonatronospira]EFI35393.1 argininosuccinate lyase [Desulfonatronospira thiodismutans ASO3-1]RQD73420.1 MAG: argininosuccinate lyase [Desulfonatronospira sp. MSAO_Bac3]
MKGQEKQKLWGGRFTSATSSLVEDFTQSLDFDRFLALHDLEGSRAHARMLAHAGIISEDELQQILSGLDRIENELEQDEFTWDPGLEDVHMNIEKRLTDLIGAPGQKLHTGRSRNDQVALDFRLYTAAALQEWQQVLKELIQALTRQAQAHRDTLIPGYTHLQPAQPVCLAQHLLAYARMFMRDHERIEDALPRVKVSPLGAAALAGTTYPLQPEQVAEHVGFEYVFKNSMDAVSDRDFVLEGLFIASMIMMHLSRLGEEIILWSNPGFGFIILPDAYSTGSSIMPQKKNPDVAELVRGKTGGVYGRLMALLTTMKALPLTYNRDMQEDKEPFIEAHRSVSSSLRVMAGMIAQTEFDRERMFGALKDGYLNATELADYLVARGMPFRQAHHITGRLVAFAEEKGLGLEDIDLDTFRSFSEIVDSDVYHVLDYQQAVKRRVTPGGTGPDSVDEQIRDIKGWMDRKNGGSV